jgi:uncharacterized protein YneF (UPF0154 family)
VTDLAILAIGVAALIVGIALGMLVAPRISRWANRADEEQGDDRQG